MALMNKIGLPKISVTFQEAATTAPIRFSQSKVALAIVDTTLANNLLGTEDNPSFVISAKKYEEFEEMTSGYIINQSVREYVARAFIGAYGNTPSLVYISCATTIDKALDNLKIYDFDWISAYNSSSAEPESQVRDSDMDEDEEGTTPTTPTLVIATGEKLIEWVDSMRESGKRYKAVVASEDTSSIATSNPYIKLMADEIIMNNGEAITAREYTSRIAGLVASIPLSQSCTYYILDDLKSVTYKATTEIETAIKAGNFVLMNDGDVVRVARGVMSNNSKIKYIAIKDKIEADVKASIKDSFIGKYAATYNNKCLLIAALKNYFSRLAKSEIINNEISVAIDIDSQRKYLESKGIATENMSEKEIKTYETGDEIFIIITLKIIDAMENFEIVIKEV